MLGTLKAIGACRTGKKCTLGAEAKNVFFIILVLISMDFGFYRMRKIILPMTHLAEKNFREGSVCGNNFF